MSIFAVGDLHLSLSENVDKPMDKYGPRWEDHAKRLKESWCDTVDEDDAVIIAGDISWGLKFNEAVPDLDFISELPGKKVLIKGNHDLWWNSITRLNSLYNDMTFLQNTCFRYGDHCICGSRGWLCPGNEGFTAADRKIYDRELLRCERSLQAAREEGAEKIIFAIHFPPTNDKLQTSGFTDLFTEYKVDTVVYGHLHGEEAYGNGFMGYLNNVEYKLVSLDYLNCRPALIKDDR